MNYPILHHTDFIYCRLMGYSWRYNQTFEASTLHPHAGKILTKTYEEIECDLPFIVNCQGMNDIAQRGLESLQKYIPNIDRTIVFTNVHKALEDMIKNELDNSPTCTYQSEKGYRVLYYGSDNLNIDTLKSFESVALELEKKFALKWVSDCRIVGETRLTSTPLMAPVEFDAKNIISNSDRFLWMSLFMADKYKQLFDDCKGYRDLKIIAVSLKGSPFAASIASLREDAESLEIIDHVGPKYKIFEEYFHSEIVDSYDYIYIGDFTVGGTEIKIADTYARSRGAKVVGALVVASYLNSSEYNLDIQVDSVVSLKDCFPDLKYSF